MIGVRGLGFLGPDSRVSGAHQISESATLSGLAVWVSGSSVPGFRWAPLIAS